MSTGQAPSYHTSEDEQLLHKLGYAQELFRAMGGFRNFAISFTIISILAGCLTSYYHRVPARRPSRRHVGLAASSGSCHDFVALSMAEIASTYPTAGGLYYWASKLGSPAWGWFTGWFNLIGLIADHRRRSATGSRSSRRRSSTSGGTTRTTTRAHLLRLRRGVPARCDVLQHLRRPDHVGSEHDLGLLAHDRRRDHRRSHPDHRPRPASVASYVFTETVNNSGFSGSGLELDHVLDGLRDRLDRHGPVHDDRVRRVGAHGRGDAARPRDRRRPGWIWSVVVSVIFGFILLAAITFAIPDQTAVAGAVHLHHDRTSGRVDEPALGRVPALHLRRRAVLLPHGVDHVGVADAVRVLARPRRARSSGSGVASSRHRVPTWSVLGVAFCAGSSHDADRSGTTSSATTSARPIGDDRPLHRVHPARHPSLSGRATASSPAPGASAATTSGSTRSRSSGSSSSRSSSCSRSTRSGCPGATASPGTSLNYATADDRRRIRSSSAAGGCCRRRTGSRARCGWAPRRSSNGSRRSSSASSSCRPKRTAGLVIDVRGAPQGAPRRSAPSAARNARRLRRPAESLEVLGRVARRSRSRARRRPTARRPTSPRGSPT